LRALGFLPFAPKITQPEIYDSLCSGPDLKLKPGFVHYTEKTISVTGTWGRGIMDAEWFRRAQRLKSAQMRAAVDETYRHFHDGLK
jgi:hypothetical protein